MWIVEIFNKPHKIERDLILALILKELNAQDIAYFNLEFRVDLCQIFLEDLAHKLIWGCPSRIGENQGEALLPQLTAPRFFQMLCSCC